MHASPLGAVFVARSVFAKDDGEDCNAWEEYDMHPRTKVLTMAVLCGLLTLSAAPGCAGRSSETTQTTTTEAAPTADDGEMERPGPVERTTTTTTTESDQSSPGIIGSAFGLVWAVISFPFRVVGALF